MIALTPLFLAAAVAAAPAGGGIGDFLGGPMGSQFLLIGALFAAFYFILILPSQRRQREHQAKIAGVKRGDTVIMSSGIKGKVVRVEESEVGVEIAQNVTVKVVKSMIADVVARGEPAAANDSKS